MSDGRLEAGIGTGATQEFSLRVSVAALARVLFQHPQGGETMLALERRATLYDPKESLQVKSQPFGGTLRIHDVLPLQNLIGDFHFDSESSHLENDFRLFIRPSDWEAVRSFCLEHFQAANDPALEADPWRELQEEFAEVLGIQLHPAQVSYQLVGTVLEEQPSPTENIHASGSPTARIYRIFEAQILDPSLATTLISKSDMDSDRVLNQLMLESKQENQAITRNMVLVLPCEPLISLYSSLSPEIRNTPVSFQNHLLDETVAAVLGVDVPKYRRC